MHFQKVPITLSRPRFGVLKHNSENGNPHTKVGTHQNFGWYPYKVSKLANLETALCQCTTSELYVICPSFLQLYMHFPFWYHSSKTQPFDWNKYSITHSQWIFWKSFQCSKLKSRRSLLIKIIPKYNVGFVCIVYWPGTEVNLDRRQRHILEGTEKNSLSRRTWRYPNARVSRAKQDKPLSTASDQRSIRRWPSNPNWNHF